MGIVRKAIDRMQCALGDHRDEYKFSRGMPREDIYQCRVCGSYFVVQSYIPVGYRTTERPEAVPYQAVEEVEEGEDYEEPE